MKALITGAGSGIGRDIAVLLSQMGYDIIAVGRRENRLLELKKMLTTHVEVVVCDVSDIESCKSLARFAPETDILVNNAGFGVFGDFLSNDLDRELMMIDTNAKAMHILMKLFLRAWEGKNKGHILNVASAAAFFPGPLFASYYASKSYILRLSQAINEELRRKHSHIKISVLCPGPTKTEFGSVANVSFGSNDNGKGISLPSMEVAEAAVRGMFSGKEIIIPGGIMKCAAALRYILPDKILSRLVYDIQSKSCHRRDDENA